MADNEKEIKRYCIVRHYNRATITNHRELCTDKTLTEVLNELLEKDDGKVPCERIEVKER
ncbi:MAG: hypothetical protein DRO87_11650 [Candidatus Thorarchaeota archaeon]|nr:MAG: hypothetical protein DRO87_11650 [Candidatus Thorarchaeota archaeon]